MIPLKSDATSARSAEAGHYKFSPADSGPRTAAREGVGQPQATRRPTTLPDQLQPQLNLPRARRRRRDASGVLVDGAVRVEHSRRRRPEIRAIQQVEALEPELQLRLADVHALSGHQIDGSAVRPDDRVARERADEAGG